MKNLILMLLVLCLAFTYADNWQSVPANGDIPSPRFGHTMVQINGTYYLFGGVNALDSRATPFNDLYAYVPTTKTFTKVTTNTAPGSQPVPGMAGHTAMVYNNEMYLFNGERSEAANSATYVFTPGNNTWTQKSVPPYEARSESAAASDEGTMYMVGGKKTATGAITDEAWKYDFATDAWTRRNPMPWGGVAGASAIICPDANGTKKLYIYGGFNAQGEQAVVWEQTPAYNSWMMANQFGEMPPPRGYAVSIGNGSDLWVSGGFGASSSRESQQLGDTYKLDFKNAQGPTWTKVKDGPVHWKAAGYLVVDGEDINLCVLGGIKDNAPIALNTVSQYSTNDDPPPVPKNITSQIGALGNNSYALYFFAFNEDQAKVTVNIAWKQADAELRLCALYIPIMIRGDHPMANMAGLEDDPDHISAEHLMMLQRSKEAVERISPITKTFTNLKRGTLVLLLIHKNRTPTARNIQLALSDYTTLPKNVTFLFPVGNPDKNSISNKVVVQTSFMKFPTTPIRWKARLPLINYLKEIVTPGDIWTWACEDTFPRPFFFPAYVKFALP